MSKIKDLIIDDEINLKELILSLWRGKYIIIIFIIIAICFASYYLRNAERKYTVTYILKPVSASENSFDNSGLGGFAALTGFALPKNSGTDFRIFQELLSTVEVFERVYENKNLVKKLFLNEWDEKKGLYSRIKLSEKQEFLRKVKSILTGSSLEIYMPPNPRRLAVYFKKNVTIVEDTDTRFIHLKSETTNPEKIISLIVEASEISDQIMRERYVKFSEEPLAFYKHKLRTAKSREHREALAQLIGKEEQKLMLAASSKYFIAEPFVKPTISIQATSPRPKTIFSLFALIGSFIGAVLAMLLYFKSER